MERKYTQTRRTLVLGKSQVMQTTEFALQWRANSRTPNPPDCPPLFETGHKVLGVRGICPFKSKFWSSAGDRWGGDQRAPKIKHACALYKLHTASALEGSESTVLTLSFTR